MSKGLDLSVYAVLDPARCRGRDPVALAAAAARGGATLVQLRDKTSSTRALVTLARAVKEALDPHGVPLLINDRIDVALAAGAAGAHVGQSDMDPRDARRLLGPDAILGVTLHHAREAEGLEPGLADYAGMGPVFVTQSKDPGDPPLGPSGLARLIGGVREQLPGLPCCGIAGVDHTNAASVIEAGADGVAVISDIFMEEDVEAATARLRDAVRPALAGRSTP
ncbi:thiamine phosphate synthase [Geminicoccaceae bacterium 1502E]|nr:thiamine phosphate synthase [Geminicoccaceae bacterium 1502E]